MLTFSGHFLQLAKAKRFWFTFIGILHSFISSILLTIADWCCRLFLQLRWVLYMFFLCISLPLHIIRQKPVPGNGITVDGVLEILKKGN